MADASETFERILASIHSEAVSAQRASAADARIEAEDPDGVLCSPPCAAHAAFASVLVSRWRCRSCGASTDPVPLQAEMAYPVYVAQVKDAMERFALARAMVASRLALGAPLPAPARGLGGLPPIDAPGAPVDLAGILSSIAYDELCKDRDARVR